METREDLLISASCIAGKIVEAPKKGYLYIDLEKAKDYWLKGGMFREIALNAGYEESELVPVKNEWESRFVGKKIEGYFVEPLDNNVYGYEENFRASLYCKHIFKTEKQAKSALAYAQLTQLMALPEYNGDWVADWTAGNIKKSVIRSLSGALEINSAYELYYPICFKYDGIRDEFLKNNRDLLKQYFEMD